MPYSIISDLHIKGAEDEAYALLISFLTHRSVVESSAVFLLGDIFDLLLGKQEFYYSQYNLFFEALKNLVNNDVKIYYFEGNHDFHLRKLFKNFLIENGLPEDSIRVERKGFTLKNWNKLYYFAHGDELEPDNRGYIIYKRLLNNKLTSILMNHIVSGRFIEFIGRHASAWSKKSSKKRFEQTDRLEKVKDKFRIGAENIALEHNCDFIICGHSHIKDDFVLPSGGRYINNGHGFHEKTFVRIENGEFTRVNIY